MAFETEIVLAVLDSVPEPSQIRAFWNANENNVLDTVPPERVLWLGVTRAVTPEEPRSPGPAGRVFDLIFFRGTTPEYTAPQLTAHFAQELMDAFVADGADVASADAQRLRIFLSHHVGRYVVAG